MLSCPSSSKAKGEMFPCGGYGPASNANLYPTAIAQAPSLSSVSSVMSPGLRVSFTSPPSSCSLFLSALSSSSPGSGYSLLGCMIFHRSYEAPVW